MDYPSGWYWASFSEELRPGKVKAVEYMGRRLALFRTKRGEPALIDAQCCHMGADLGRSGVVLGERLACGYHGWEFATDGRCERMPQVEHVPTRACQQALPVVEAAGNVWFWYGSDTPTKAFPDVSYFDDRSEFLTIKGEAHVGHTDPLPIIEHIADVYHFEHNHKASGPLEYQILRNEGDAFEFQLRPLRGGPSKIQRLFHPYAFTEMVGPCSALYRTQDGPGIDRRHPMLTMVLGVTPIREGRTVWTWRVVVRRPLRGKLARPIDYAFARLLWAVIRRNVHADLDVISWMMPNDRPLLVKPDTSSVRDFQAYYRRNIYATPELDLRSGDEGRAAQVR